MPWGWVDDRIRCAKALHTEGPNRSHHRRILHTHPPPQLSERDDDLQHWLPWVILAFVWGDLSLVNMLMKEASMSRYPDWAAYKSRTGMLLPKLFL